MNTKAKGSRNERKTRDYLLRHKGCHRVIKAGASLGEFDLVGWNDQWVFCVQVKSNRLPSPRERADMLAVPVPENFIKEMWVWKDGVKEPRMEVLG